MTDIEVKLAELALERDKFEEARRSSARSQEFEERKFAAEQSKSKWVHLSTQLSVVIPVLTLLIGAIIGRMSDNAKTQRTEELQIQKQYRDFIHQQLSEFYYPVEVRLQQDDDTWHLAFPQQTDPESLKKLIIHRPTFSGYIQKTTLIPNEQRVLQIVEEHGDLIENSYEGSSRRQHVEDLLNELKQYRVHVALYRALMENNLNMTPADLEARDNETEERFRYPENLEPAVERRIADLYDELRELGEKPPSSSWLRFNPRKAFSTGK